jgi:hypothetical protein
MPKFIIQETIAFEVEGATAQDALDDWLNAGEQAPGYAFREVSEREVFDADWNPQEVEEA